MMSSILDRTTIVNIVKVFKISTLAHVNKFTLAQAALQVLETLKKDMADSVTQAIDPTNSFTVETDASKCTIAATLIQKRFLGAFFSHTFSCNEQKHTKRKEAYVRIEAL